MTSRLIRLTVPLAIAAVLALPFIAGAQQTTQPTPPPAKAKPAPKKQADPKQGEPKQAQPKQAQPKQAPAKQPAAKQPQPKQAQPKQAPPAGPAVGAQPTLLGQYGEWGAYAAVAGGKKVCYALAKPGSAQTDPPNRPRDPAYMFVSTRPGENVRNEVSIVVGYPFKPASEATVEIGPGNKFAMYTQNDGAWIRNAAEEARMVEAMRKGADLVVNGESGRGTKSIDRYSLKGLAQALDRVAAECK